MTIIYNEVGGGNSVKEKNTGASSEKAEGPIKRFYLATENAVFTDAEIRTNPKYNDYIKSKDLVVMYEVEVPEDNNTDAKVSEKRFKDSKTKNGVQGYSLTSELSNISHENAKSYDSSTKYTRFFNETVANEISCESQEDGTIKGQPIASFFVGLRTMAKDDASPQTKFEVKFKEHAVSYIKPDFKLSKLEGIYNVRLSITGTSAASIKFKATLPTAGNMSLDSLTSANIILRDETGAIATSTFVPYDSDREVYELTGTGFKTGYTIEIDDVQTIDGINYEGAKTTITI